MTLRIDTGEEGSGALERGDATSLVALCDALGARRSFTYLHLGSDPQGFIESVASNPRCQRIVHVDLRAEDGGSRHGDIIRVPDASLLRGGELAADICFIAGDAASGLSLARFSRRAIAEDGVIVFADRTQRTRVVQSFLRELPKAQVYPLTYDLLVIEIGASPLLGDARVDARIPRPIWRALARAGVLRHALIMAPLARRLELWTWRAVFPHLTPHRIHSLRLNDADRPSPGRPTFGIHTFVTDEDQYTQMRASFTAAGFDPAGFTRLSDDGDDPYRAITRLGEQPPARFPILCHQDVRADRGAGPTQLLRALEQLDATDPKWVAAGTAGVTSSGRHVRCLVDPVGGPSDDDFPVSVISLDENLLVLNARNRPRCSPDLSGFHLYGTDICLNALGRGGTAFVIEFPITHLSSGRREHAYRLAKARFTETWSKAFAFRFVVTQTGPLFLSRSKLLRNVFGSTAILGYIERACTDPNVSPKMLPVTSVSQSKYPR